MDDFEFVDLTFGETDAVAVPAISLDPERQVGAYDRLKVSLNDVLMAVKPVTEAVHNAVKSAAPDETTVTFKVGVAISSGKAFAFIADGKVDGAIEISLKWDK